MKKILLIIMFFMWIPVITPISIYAEGSEQFNQRQEWGTSAAKEEIQEYSNARMIFDVIKFFALLGLILLVLLSPAIIWLIVYLNVPEDSTIKRIMDIANGIFAVLTLGLICLDAYNDKRNR